MPDTGDRLPQLAFTLGDGREAGFGDYAGKWLVLYFYPKDNTPGCTQEGADFRDRYPDFRRAGCQVLGISRDSLKAHESFKAKMKFPLELLSDPEERVCGAFGVMKTGSFRTSCDSQQESSAAAYAGLAAALLAAPLAFGEKRRRGTRQRANVVARHDGPARKLFSH